MTTHLKLNVVFFSLTATTNLKPACAEITHEEDAPGELTAHLHTLRRRWRGEYFNHLNTGFSGW